MTRTTANTDEQARAVAVSCRRTEAVRTSGQYYRGELRWWTDLLRGYRDVPPSARASEEKRDRVDVNRAFLVARLSDRRSDIEVDESKVVVPSTPVDTPDDALTYGQRLSTVLLNCNGIGHVHARRHRRVRRKPRRDQGPYWQRSLRPVADPCGPKPRIPRRSRD